LVIEGTLRSPDRRKSLWKKPGRGERKKGLRRVCQRNKVKAGFRSSKIDGQGRENLKAGDDDRREVVSFGDGEP